MAAKARSQAKQYLIRAPNLQLETSQVSQQIQAATTPRSQNLERSRQPWQKFVPPHQPRRAALIRSELPRSIRSPMPTTWRRNQGSRSLEARRAEFHSPSNLVGANWAQDQMAGASFQAPNSLHWLCPSTQNKMPRGRPSDIASSWPPQLPVAVACPLDSQAGFPVSTTPMRM